MKALVMSGSGNTFLVIDNRDGIFKKRILNKIRSEGLDGIILLESGGKGDFRMRVINPDGSEPGMCGNGARCIARFSTILGITGNRMDFETQSGMIHAEVLDDLVRIRMGDPKDIVLNKSIIVNGDPILVHCIDTGVPHAVIFQKEDIKRVNLKELGPLIRWHPQFFPNGTNVDFVNIKDEDTIMVRTYERGVEGETMACGTGVVASSCVGYLLGKLKPPVNVLTQGGETLKVFFKDIDGKITNLWLEGGVKVLREEDLDV